MFRKRKLVKAVALFFTLQILFDAVFPTLTYALTSGPTAPEATSFEPVDTTDMVNLLTGDFTYNIPLLEVPGPAGGYPISLSYHAGIQTNEDASWVGLGWNLNTGAIARNVNGFADDHWNVITTDRFFWEGGNRETYSIGVSVGLPDIAASVSAGLSFSQDTYKGFGVGAYAGVGVGIGNSPLSMSNTVGINPYGGYYASAGLGVGVGNTSKGALNLSTNVGISTNFESVSGGVGASVGYGYKGMGNVSLLGASISTGGTTSSLSMGGGVVNINNSHKGDISTSSSGFSANIPTPWPGLWISLGYKFERYWINELENVMVNGALYYPNGKIPENWLDRHAYDTYNLYEENLSLIDKTKPATHERGLSFPNVDDYLVNAQGIVGNIKPYFFQKHLLRQNIKNGDIYDVRHFPTGYDENAVHFRFINDFSNRYLYDPVNFKFTENLIQFDFSDASPVTGENGNDGIVNNHLAGSRHIQYLTNKQIIDKDGIVGKSGFIETRSTGFVRSRDLREQIGAFVITNETGVKYHFSLPVYSYNEYQYSENIKEESGKTFNEVWKPEKYAYTWYLTAITGPDFVDRGEVGKLDREDWGYWIEFEYGKWTEQYYWRNPSSNFRRDLDANFQNFSEGTKELYYLDAVRTKSHTAIFIKDIRRDAKSSVPILKNKGYDIRCKLGKSELLPENRNGGFKAKRVRVSCEQGFGLFDNQNGFVEYVARPTSTLSLRSIYLFNNEVFDELNLLKEKGNEFKQTFAYEWTVERDKGDCRPCDFSTLTFEHHLPDNVYDKFDIDELVLKRKSLRSINFNTDESLVPQTDNSFDYSLVNMDSPQMSNYPLKGKLTLKGLRFLGKGGAELMPPLLFEYDLDTPIKGTSYFGGAGSSRTSSVKYFDEDNSGLTIGDIIKIGTNCDYFLITKIQENRHYIKDIGNTSSCKTVNGIHTWSQTKNPPYNHEYYDIWGMYKSDFTAEFLPINENFARLVTDVSAKSLDVWSLRKIISPTGAKIKIEYEPDAYFNASSKGNYPYIIDKVKLTDEYSVAEISFKGQVNYEDFKKLIGSHAGKILAILHDKISNTYTFRSDYRFLIKDVKDDAIVVSSTLFYEPLNGQRPEVIGGNFALEPSTPQKGGGIRTRSVSVEGIGEVHRTSYLYSEGVTSYEPLLIDNYYVDFGDNPTEHQKNVLDQLKRAISKQFVNLLINARELPAPGVMYGDVTVQEEFMVDETTELLGKSNYKFQTYHTGLTGTQTIASHYQHQDNVRYYNGMKYTKINWRKAAQKNFTSQVGNLKSITLYDNEGNKISETVSHYLHEECMPVRKDNNTINYFATNVERYEPLLERYKNQGVIEETFIDARFINKKFLYTEDDYYHLLGVISKKEEFPSIKIGETNRNYKTGITSTTKTLAFDFYSGQKISSLTEDSYGNAFISEVLPAYRKYKQMGLAINGGKNMLFQSAGNIVYKVNTIDYKPIGLISASAQTWSKDIAIEDATTENDIWRKHARYIWNGQKPMDSQDGTYPIDHFNAYPFDYTKLSANQQWQKQSEITLYDLNSHALEATDINGNYAATRMDPLYERVLASAANAAYTEIAYSGTENSSDFTMEGGVSNGEGIASMARSHTGSYSLQVSFNTEGFNYTLGDDADLSKKYKASVWVYLPGESETVEEMYKVQLYYKVGDKKIAVSPDLNQNKSKNWYLLNLTIDPSGASKVYIGCLNNSSRSVYFDDFRVHPIAAQMTSYVYDEFSGELNYLLDRNNVYTKFEYDAMGRLVRTSREMFNFNFGKNKESFKADRIVNEIIYNYGESNE